MTQKIFLCALFCILFFTGYAQNCSYTFKGTVTDYHDGTSIFGATVYLKNLDRYTTTDYQGKFEIKNLCKGELQVIFSHVSCETKEVLINLTEDTFKEFNLEHHIEDLKEVRITSATGLKNKTAQTTVLKTDIIDKYSSQNLGDALKNISGVSSVNTGNTIVKPMINGLHSSRVILMTNGVRLQDQEWGIEHAPNIDINTAEKITVIKGANALEFGGDAIGGVIVVEPNRIILKDSLYGKSILTGQTNGQGFSLHSSLSKSTKKGWYLNAKTTLKNYGDFESPDYVLTNTGLKSQAFSVQTGLKKFESGFNVYYTYLKNEIGILKSSHLGNIEDLVNAINSDNPLVVDDFSYTINAPRQEVTHQLVKADLYKRYKKLGKLKVQYDYQNNQRLEFDLRIGADKNKPAIDLNLSSHAVNTSFEFDSKSNQTYKVGFMGAYQNNFADPNTGVKRLIPDYDKYDLGVFTIGNFLLNDKTSLDVGVRYDFNYINAKKFYFKSRWRERNYDNEFSTLIIGDFNTQWLVNPEFKYHNFSSSLGVSHELNPQNSFIFNYALASRAPNPSELFSDGLHHSAARIELGDLRMKQETSNRLSTSYHFNNEKTALLVELFVNHIRNFMYIEPNGTEQTIRGAFPVWIYKSTNASLFGIDINWLQKITDQINFNNKTSFIRGKDIVNSTDLIDIPAAKTQNSFGYTNKKWHQFNANFESEFVFKQNLFPDTNFEVFIPTTNSNVLVDVSSTPNSYHLLNFNTDATFKLSQKTNVTIGITVTNILNTNYREYLNRLRYFADDLGRNYLLQLNFKY
ncbi:TonB-dependent receptor [Polaribacter glomeratus]|uniref:TonB-dependent receptor n=1 Tax=Polaribacter glomeratus TaxID=102 RepID=A0A2S7WVE5_9FLAO|nr:TonB-dependent receptor [Polaribacter glomeratus]PQJ81569.1 TonB-dependent receptor [Polaribacter glomeratus]TXD64601.1 TonB-dependent receptor [Polaribacter glomeratus]